MRKRCNILPLGPVFSSQRSHATLPKAVMPVNRVLLLFVAVIVIGLLYAGAPSSPSFSASAPAPAPELPQLPASAWLNSPPLTLAALRGHPVLVEFWTFECSNCRATQPWVARMHERYGPKGLKVIAVHSPEFERERDPAAVARHVQELGIRYPVLIDNGFAYWKALDNQFWPAFYLIDPEGRLVDGRIGELHTGERSADEFERAIAAFLATAGNGAAAAN
jgi:thiol-disulfide isomerase/thioredoxin